MTDAGPWKVSRIGAFAAAVAVDHKTRHRELSITTPDGAVVEYVFTAENAETIGRLLLAPGVVAPDFPPDR